MKTQERESHGLCFTGYGAGPIVWESGSAHKIWVVEYQKAPFDSNPKAFYTAGSMHETFADAVAFAVEDRLRGARAIIAAFEGYVP